MPRLVYGSKEIAEAMMETLQALILKANLDARFTEHSKALVKLVCDSKEIVEAVLETNLEPPAKCHRRELCRKGRDCAQAGQRLQGDCRGCVGDPGDGGAVGARTQDQPRTQQSV